MAKGGKRKKKAKTKKGPYLVPALFISAFISGGLLLLLFNLYTGPSTESSAYVPEYSIPLPQTQKPSPREPVTAPKKKTHARVAIIIDDMGRDMKRMRELLEVDAPVTVSVLPHLEFSKAVATEAHSRGWEVILHLPMEPRDLENHDPGEGALFIHMSDEEILRELEKDILAVPYIIGANNHMGSRFTEDEQRMSTVLRHFKERGFFFLDSKTTGRSVARSVAERLGVRTAERNIFLDNERDVRYIKGQFEELKQMALKRKKAIAIGHPYPETIRVLKEMVKEFEDDGIRLVKLSGLLD